MDKNSFVMYTTYAEHINLLTMEQRGLLLTAIMNYASGEPLPDMDGMTRMAFSFIKVQMDRDSEKYQATVEKRRESGKLGGRPSTKANGLSEKAKKANGFSEKQTKAKKPDNDNEYDNDSDNEEYIHTPTKARACAHAEVEKPRKKSEPVKYSDDPELNDAIAEFVKFRKGIKKPMSDRAITLMMNKLESLSHDKHEQVQILNQSIMQGWTGLYALKDDGKSRGQPRNVNPNGFANFKQTDHSEQLGQLEKMLADELNNK